MYIVLAIMGAILWGIADIITKHLLKQQINLFVIILANNLISLIIVSFIVIVFNRKNEINVESLFNYNEKASILFLVVNGILITLGLILFYKAIELGKVSIASTLMSTKIIWTLLFSIAILGERLTYKEFIGIIFIFIGVLMIKG